MRTLHLSLLLGGEGIPNDTQIPYRKLLAFFGMLDIEDNKGLVDPILKDQMTIFFFHGAL